ncbi:CPBP family intramembrane glutamic endopeptidase [Novosphingobium sp.]|uniref:CPBP family intramembrane glutamic endopeptidase n=1 Tax=Novosphingobium sp. TaxID=1874826 RepID=UPI003BA893B5
MSAASPPGYWGTVRLLLASARRRQSGRSKRQQQLLSQRSDGKGTDWSGVGLLVGLIISLVIHGFAAGSVFVAVTAGQRAEAELHGHMVVSEEFLEQVQEADQTSFASPRVRSDSLAEAIGDEAARIARDQRGEDEKEIAAKLRARVAAPGSNGLVLAESAEPGLTPQGLSQPIPALLGSLLVLLWLVTLVCQGEGLELDIQRCRHPMWEWLFSHPVQPGAVFLAEMIAPLAANPTYWAGPLFVGALLGLTYDVLLGLIGAVVIGIPLTIAAGCLGKALEISAVLRLSPRTRGGMIGVISWFGFVGMVGPIVGAATIDWLVGHFAGTLAIAARLPAPLLALLLGFDGAGGRSFLRAIAFGWLLAAAMLGFAVWLSVRALRNGLSGAFAAETLTTGPARQTRFGREPLFRKEVLWFLRDRSAIVQTILIPLTVAGYNMFQLRGALSLAAQSWNLLAGAAIALGTYMLWVLGPKSLVSEGSALWIALTWPQGIESVLKAKAWLWSLIATLLVAVVLLLGCALFPQDWWKIALVGVGWYLFARSMAEKAVTLVTVVSESGEAQPIPSGRRWAAQLGMLTFAIGICTQVWSLAIVGIVYSWVTAAAMWENFRARLPYLYDPWSEKLPPPPTLMHAMIAVSAMLELSSVIAAFVAGIGGRENLPLAMAVGYSASAVLVSMVTARVLEDRGMNPAAAWLWSPPPAQAVHMFVAPWETLWNLLRYHGRAMAEGLALGLLLGGFAWAYIHILAMFSPFAHDIAATHAQWAANPSLRFSYAFIAILCAPFAEEYLFRGLLYRALDRQWGGWKAVLAAAAFFAIYHPPIAWLPVGLLGALNCVMFKRTGRLAPAVVLHMAYNTVVVLTGS